MFKHIFDLSYVRNFEEAIVFYFCYFIFCYYVCGVVFIIADFFKFPLLFILLFFTPFIFYTAIDAITLTKKNLKNSNSRCLLTYTVLITLLSPLLLMLVSILFFGDSYQNFKDFGMAYIGGLIIWFLPSIAFAGIPAAILSTKEDLSIRKIIKNIDKEEIKNAVSFEKEFLIDRIIKKEIK